jgi:hypothetical protein
MCCAGGKRSNGTCFSEMKHKLIAEACCLLLSLCLCLLTCVLFHDALRRRQAAQGQAAFQEEAQGCWQGQGR